MPRTRDLEYQAQYQRRLRAARRASGRKQLNAAVKDDLVNRLDRLKADRGLSNRDSALELVLEAFFACGEQKGKSP